MRGTCVRPGHSCGAHIYIYLLGFVAKLGVRAFGRMGALCASNPFHPKKSTVPRVPRLCVQKRRATLAPFALSKLADEWFMFGCVTSRLPANMLPTQGAQVRYQFHVRVGHQRADGNLFTAERVVRTGQLPCFVEEEGLSGEHIQTGYHRHTLDRHEGGSTFVRAEPKAKAQMELSCHPHP